MLVGVLMSGLAIVVERRLIKALRQGTVERPRPAREAGDDAGGGLVARSGSEEVGDQAGGEGPARAAEHDGHPAFDSG